MTSTDARRRLALATAPRRGLRMPDAAVYVGVSETLFQSWIEKGLMPKPTKRIDGVILWDIKALDEAWDALPDGEGRVASQSKWARLAS